MRLASRSFRRQLLGKLLVQRWRDSSGNVRLSRLLMSFLSVFVTTGAQLGTIISLPLSAVLCHFVGWQVVFYAVGRPNHCHYYSVIVWRGPRGVDWSSG